MKAAILSLCGVLGVVAGVAFFAQACVSYAATPSDPQKSIGYFFIGIDSLLIGGSVFGLSSALASLFHGGKSVIGRVALAVICAAILGGILTHHWRDLFPRPGPNQTSPQK